MKAGDLAGDGGDLPLCWATKYLLLISGPTTNMNQSFPGSKPGSPASSCLPRVSCPIWTSRLSVAYKAHFVVLKLLSKSIFGSAAFWTDTPVSPGFSRQQRPSSALPQTHICFSRCSVHCTRTMPSNGECSHTTPQVPSWPTTNCNRKEVGELTLQWAFPTRLWAWGRTA